MSYVSKRKYVQMGAGDRLFKVARSQRSVPLGMLARRKAFKRTRKSYKGLNRRGVASAETGFVDLASGAFAIDTTGTIALIATVAQGASVNQRVGKKIIWKSLQMRGNSENSSTAGFNDCAMLIVYDKRPTGSLPAITDVLATANSGAFNNDANSGRFRILKREDWVMVSRPLNLTGTESSAVSNDFYLNLKGLPCVYKAAGTGAIGDIEEGALYCITVGDKAAGTTAAQGNFAFRTRFVDV